MSVTSKNHSCTKTFLHINANKISHSVTSPLQALIYPLQIKCTTTLQLRLCPEKINSHHHTLTHRVQSVFIPLKASCAIKLIQANLLAGAHRKEKLLYFPALRESPFSLPPHQGFNKPLIPNVRNAIFHLLTPRSSSSSTLFSETHFSSFVSPKKPTLFIPIISKNNKTMLE